MSRRVGELTSDGERMVELVLALEAVDGGLEIHRVFGLALALADEAGLEGVGHLGGMSVDADVNRHISGVLHDLVGIADHVGLPANTVVSIPRST